MPSLWVERAAICPDGPSTASGEGTGGAEPSAASGGCSEAEHRKAEGANAAAGYLWSASVRSTDLDFSPQKNLNSYPALQATERGSSRGNLSPLTVFWFLLYAQKERHDGEPYRLCLCKRLRDADGRDKIITFCRQPLSQPCG